jgi:hypothetical protein
MPQEQGDVLRGDDGTDIVRGTVGKDVISALAGDDVILGLGSGDALAGGAGADTLREGAADGLLVIDRTDTLVDGGDGIDTVILSPGSSPYSFSPTNLRNVEAIQDAPGADTTILFDARILAGADDDSFLFALGDGTDEIRIENATAAPVIVEGNAVVYNGEVVLRFEGVESLVLTGGDGNSSSVVTQSLSPNSASSTTVRSFSGGDGGNTTTVTSVTTGTTDAAEPGAVAENPTEVAGPNSAAAILAEALFSEGATDADLGPLAEPLSQWLEIHARAAEALRQEDATAATGTIAGNLFADDLFGPTGLFGLLSDDILRGGSDADLAAIG